MEKSTNVPGGQSNSVEQSSIQPDILQRHEKAPIHFTARLQYPLSPPSNTSVSHYQRLSLFRNPFYPRVPGGRRIPNIYNEFDANRVVYSIVHDGIMGILVQLYADALEEDFDTEFIYPGGQERFRCLVVSGSLSDFGVVNIEDYLLALELF